MRVVTSIAVALALGSTFVAAQATKATPGPEHKRMAYFAGQWNYQGEAKNSPLGPGGKIAGTETCEWFAGGFQLVCRTKGTGPKGPGTGQSVVGYDPHAESLHLLRDLEPRRQHLRTRPGPGEGVDVDRRGDDRGQEDEDCRDGHRRYADIDLVQAGSLHRGRSDDRHRRREVDQGLKVDVALAERRREWCFAPPPHRQLPLERYSQNPTLLLRPRGASSRKIVTRSRHALNRCSRARTGVTGSHARIALSY